jgi:Fe-S cluster assembly protein SufD
MTRTSILERIRHDFDAVAGELPAIAASPGARRDALQALSQVGWPSARDEQWRYANLRAFDQVAQFSAAQPQAAANASVVMPALPPPLPDFERWVFVDGIRVDGATHTGRSAGEAPDCSGTWGPDQRLGWLGDIFGRDTALVQTHGEAAIEVLFVTTSAAADASVYPRLQVQLQPGSRLKLVERHLGCAGASTLVSANIRIDVASGAHLSHYRLQQSGPRTVFADTLIANVAADAVYQVRQIAIGASTARTSALVQLSGRAAALDWQSIAVGRGEQVHDLLLRVEHQAPETRTTEVFRGIAEELARIAFNAHIDICAQARGSQARQSLRGLIEGARAEIDLRPRLQINTDEVRAQHGATTGQLDENLLFYLLSRGLDPKTARALLKWAFLGDVLRAVDLPALRAAAEQAAADQLPDVVAVGALT